MKKLGDIMEDLGFRQEGSFEVKKAFIKNLIRQANESEAQRKLEREFESDKTSPSQEDKNLGDEQLSLFNQKKSS
jgi:hypothetical protein